MWSAPVLRALCCAGASTEFSGIPGEGYCYPYFSEEIDKKWLLFMLTWISEIAPDCNENERC